MIDAYALTLAALLLTGGSLADLFGRRRVFVIGIVIFTVASALCALAGTPLVLNLARALQGVGGAFMFATSLALLASAFQGRDRGTAFGVWGAVTGASVAVGPLVGGVLTDGIGWEAIFLVNVPIGIAAIAMTLAKVEESHAPSGGRLDWPGLFTFSGGLFALIFALIRGNAEGWGDPLIVGCLAAAVVLGIAFVLVERRSAQPMLDLSLFSKPAFAGASIAAFVLSASMFSMFLYLTLYIQNILGYSPLESGLRFLPVTLLSFMVAPVSGKLAERLGIRWFLGAGLFCVGLGLLLMSGLEAGRRLDGAARGLPRRRRRDRARQPAARHRRGRRRRAAAGGHGVRASTRRSGRSASPPASPGSARSSSTSWPRTSSSACPPRGCRRACARTRSRTSSPSAARSGSATTRWRARPSRPSSTGSTTSSSTPRSSPSWARRSRPC